MSIFRPTRAERRALEAENRLWPETLKQVPRDEWPEQSRVPPERLPVEVWRSRAFLVQIFHIGGIERLTVCRALHTGDSWADGISWDDLQRLKSECGRGDKDAVEVFPADKDVVNVANMRHLWVMPEPLPFAWRVKS